MRAINIIKFIGAWFCIGAAVVLLVINRDMQSMIPLSLLSGAFSWAPADA